MKFLKKIPLFILIAASFSLLMPSSAAFAFDKNNLIDDAVFTDTDSMSVSEIQSFLNSRGSLLANWKDTVNMRRPSDNCVVHHATGKTAAQIIHEAATKWGAQVYDSNGCAISGKYWSQPAYSGYTLKTVSPKVLLVTLQKEQSLLSANGGYNTDPNAYKNPACCSSNTYKLARAMGYGVPDSGGINEKYLGFYNQIMWAAWQLRYNYERAGGNTSWDEVGYLTYGGPMTAGKHRRCSSCPKQNFDGYYPIDGKNLFMANRATASLYYYTPHTYPGYFGNYNFVNFFKSWFGSVRVTLTFPDGMLIKGDNSPTVYWTENGKKRPLTLASVFESHKFKWGDVEVFPQKFINGFPSGDSLKFAPSTLLKGTGPTVYIVEIIGGKTKKTPFTKPGVFESLGFKYKDVVTVKNSHLPPSSGAGISKAVRHPNGSLIRFPGKNTVYFIKGGKLRPLTIELHLTSNGFKWSDVKQATASDANIPRGDVMYVREGTLVKTKSSAAIFIVNLDKNGNTKLRPITSGSFMKKYKFSIKDVETVSNQFVKTTPKGNPVQ